MSTETQNEHDDEYYQQAYVDLVWQLADGVVNPSLEQVGLVLAAAGKLPHELDRDVADYVKARDEREWLESIFDGHVKARVDGWPIHPREFPELLEALGRSDDDFYKAVLSEQIKRDQGY